MKPLSATRYLYLVRHAAVLPDESGLTEAGRRQAVLLGRRLQDVPFATIHHSPLPRAAQTADLVNQQLRERAVLRPSEAAGDYVPYIPPRAALPSASADYYLDFLEATPAEPALAQQALTDFTGPTTGDRERHDLLITHNFLAAWLVRDALDAPPWRWLTLNHANAALTLIRYTPDRPAALLTFNDTSHLPAGMPK